MRPDKNLCPPRIVEAFINYRDHGILPSDFVRACLENNFMEAAARADDVNNEALPHIAAWLYWEMPSRLWKSREAVNAHLATMFAMPAAPKRRNRSANPLGLR